jgi:hypothetical protein
MDRVRDRLAALAEEVGEFAQPPGVAMTVRRARRRRQREVGLVTVGLLTVMVAGLAIPNLLEGFGQGTGRGLLGGAERPRTTASSPATTRSSGPFGPLTISSVARVVAPGEQMTLFGEGCSPIEQGTISVAGMGIQKSVPINGDGSFSAQFEVPGTARHGIYDLVVRCYVTKDMVGVAVDRVVVRAYRIIRAY